MRGLTALGYEVRENMATAWAENGRVIVRKPQEPDYGIELKSPPAGEAVQARVVAFARNAERSASEVQRDREVEQTWCGEFQKMRELLLADGFGPALLHAAPAGEIPMKVEPQSVAEQRDLRSIVKPNQAREERT